MSAPETHKCPVRGCPRTVDVRTAKYANHQKTRYFIRCDTCGIDSRVTLPWGQVKSATPWADMPYFRDFEYRQVDMGSGMVGVIEWRDGGAPRQDQER